MDDPIPSASLAQQLEELRARVRRLEEALHRQGIALPAADAEAAAPAAPISATAPATAVAEGGAAGFRAAGTSPAAPTPSAAGMPQSPVADRRSLESRIGSQWFNRIGILAVLVGAAWFLKLAIDNHWIGPLERVLIGLLAGIGILFWAERFRRSGYAGFGSSLHAAGSGILYLSLWAAFSLFHLFSGSVAFAAMVIVTAMNGYLSWAREAELLAFYSLAGGLATPLLLSNGVNHEAALFTYLLLLDIAVLALIAVRPWPRLPGAAFAGTVFFFALWWSQYYSAAQSGRTAFFLACFLLIFALAPRLFPFDGDAGIAPASRAARLRWKSPVLVLLPIANAGLGFLGFYGIVSSSHAAWAAAWVACAFALFYLSLFRFLRGGGPAELPPLHLAAAVVFLTLAIPLWTHGRWLTIGWLAEGAALLGASAHVPIAVLRVLAVSCLALGLIALVAIYPPAAPTLFLNQRFATFCVGIAIFAVVTWMSSARRQQPSVPAALSWSRLAFGAAIVLNVLVLLAIGWEIHSYWARLGAAGDWRSLRDARVDAQFTYSAFFMLFGGLLLAAGFWRRSAFLRWQALLLLAATIAKVFLVDVSALSQGYRIVSFLGLGVLLLAVSFLYQRDWLGLRGTGRQSG